MPTDFSNIPKPDTIELLDFEAILQARIDRLLELQPDLADVLSNESEPLTIQMQANAYRELLLRQRINDSALAGMLAYAEKGDLDAIGVDRYKLPRLVITPEDTSTNPTTPAVMESDSAYRERLYLSADALSNAGPKGQYESLARSADGDIADAEASMVRAGAVEIAIVSHSNGGVASQALIDAAYDIVSDEDRRPMTDLVSVVQSPITTTVIEATLEMADGTDSAGAASALATALANIEALQAERKIGQVLAISRLHALLHLEGVARVTLTTPAADLDPGSNGTVIVTGASITTTSAGMAK